MGRHGLPGERQNNASVRALLHCLALILVLLGFIAHPFRDPCRVLVRLLVVYVHRRHGLASARSGRLSQDIHLPPAGADQDGAMHLIPLRQGHGREIEGQAGGDGTLGNV